MPEEKSKEVTQYRVQQEALRQLQKRLEDRGFEFPEFWKDPVQAIGNWSVLRTAELFSQEKMSDRDRISLIKTAHDIYSLASLASTWRRMKAEQDFRKRFSAEAGEAVDVEVAEEPAKPAKGSAYGLTCDKKEI
jgi:hypothetical protein